MKITKRILEQLSAYLDGEQTPEEKFETEELLKSSSALREELAKLREVKEAVGGFKHLPDDDSFESRVMQNIKNRNGFFPRYSVPRPAIIFAAATLFLMIILKTNTGFFEDWFSQGRSGIEEFYSRNLTSLLMAADLTNEDLFDFAFNKSLPLDENGNKILAIGTDLNGKEFLEVKYAAGKEEGIKLKDFVRKFNLNAEQKGKVDSILESYSDRLASVVLVNDNNTIAVNPDLWKYHNRMRQDLIEYASSVNRAALISAVGGETTINDIIHEPEPEAPRSPASGENYYFITPDSIFISRIKVDEARLKKDIASAKSAAKGSGSFEKKIKIDLSPVFSGSGEHERRSSMKVFVNDNSVKVVIPEKLSPLEMDPELDILAVRLDSVFKQLEEQSLSLRMEYPTAPGSNFSMSVRTDPRGGTSYGYGYDAPDMVVIKKDSIRGIKRPDSIASHKKKLKKYTTIVPPQIPELPDLQYFADSLSKRFGREFPMLFQSGELQEFLQKGLKDTSSVFKDGLREELRREMLLFRKEMNRLREEMKKFREELKPEEKKKAAEPIEI